MSAATQVRNGFRYAITIPDNTGTGSTIAALLAAAGFTGGDLSAVFIDAMIPGTAGTARAAFMAASTRQGSAIAAADFTTHGQYVPAGAPYYNPIDFDATQTYLRSTTGATVTALCIVGL